MVCVRDLCCRPSFKGVTVYPQQLSGMFELGEFVPLSKIAKNGSDFACVVQKFDHLCYSRGGSVQPRPRKNDSLMDSMTAGSPLSAQVSAPLATKIDERRKVQRVRWEPK
jgi:hypothetical protein